ncbi:hypothetical protein CVT25_004898 [Psilocybe cyanescens]|uniref:Uncharacterized protein n=1 Tax=Psilocybe cyanescens TaxID=93625 RepID=A0A409XBK0_PSICY|nr:hypothetical protein CVT25_004898 [Psilocybe cyanescens]
MSYSYVTNVSSQSASGEPGGRRDSPGQHSVRPVDLFIGFFSIDPCGTTLQGFSSIQGEYTSSTTSSSISQNFDADVFSFEEEYSGIASWQTDYLLDPIYKELSEHWAHNPEMTRQIFNSIVQESRLEQVRADEPIHCGALVLNRVDRSPSRQDWSSSSDDSSPIPSTSYPHYDSPAFQTSHTPSQFTNAYMPPALDSGSPCLTTATPTANTPSTVETDSDLDSEYPQEEVAANLYTRAYASSTLKPSHVVAAFEGPRWSIDIKRLERSFRIAGIASPPDYFSQFTFPAIFCRYEHSISSHNLDSSEIVFAVGNLPGARLVDLRDQTVTIQEEVGERMFESSGRRTIDFSVTFPGLTFPQHRLNVWSSKSGYFKRGELAFNIACFFAEYLQKLQTKPRPAGYRIPNGWDYKRVDISRLYIFSLYPVDGHWCANIGLL